MPLIPIATPMLACFKAGPSLTPSPVMATTCPPRLQRLDQTQFLFRADPGEHRNLFRGFDQGIVGERGKLLAGQSGRVARRQGVLDQAQLPPDGDRRAGMIPGDHLHLDSRAMARGRRGDGLRARRINHPLEAKERNIARQVTDAEARGSSG